MGEAIKNTGNEALKRWHEKMPKFFRWMMYASAFIFGMALAINTSLNMAGAQPHEWWIDIYPYLIGVSVGVMFCAKFTCDGGFREKTISHNTILDKDDN